MFATLAELDWMGDESLAQAWWRLAAEQSDASLVEDERAAGALLEAATRARIRALVDESKRRWSLAARVDRNRLRRS